jgi:hypothetical protein
MLEVWWRDAMSAPTQALWPHLQKLARLACDEFGLRLRVLKPFKPEEEEKDCFGRCYEDHTVKMRVTMIGRPSRMLSRSVIVDTLAHELAHLYDWKAGESPEHKKLRREILAFWKEKGLV